RNMANLANTGSRSSCKSSWGTFDMVGNLSEWVADWSDLANNCTDWTTHTLVVGVPLAGNDQSCFGGNGSPSASGTFGNLPGVLVRGGSRLDGAGAGGFAGPSVFDPPRSNFTIGFPCPP